VNRPIRVLALAEFDPAGVVLSHRDALALAGSPVVEIRVALQKAYTPRQLSADWIAGRDGDEALDALIAWADVVQLHPGISQIGGLTDAAYFDGGHGWPVSIDRKPAVHFVHGSKRTWQSRANFRPSGELLAASTLDYATELKCAWLPPWIPDVYGRASLRADGEPLAIAHTPTDPKNCHTAEIVKWVQSQFPAVRLNFRHGVSHTASMQAKLDSNAAFDHMRGAFSVNALEACAVGLDTYCLLLPDYAVTGFEQGMDGVQFVPNAERLFDQLAASAKSSVTTALRQLHARRWFESNFNLCETVERLERFYKEASDAV
jgi:hypothetical protein